MTGVNLWKPRVRPDVEPPSAPCRQALMKPDAYEQATDDVKQETLSHIHEAIDMAFAMPTREARAAFLGKLPPHIRERVEEWLKAFWGVDIVYVTTCDEQGKREIMAVQGEKRILPLAGICAVVKKKGA